MMESKASQLMTPGQGRDMSPNSYGMNNNEYGMHQESRMQLQGSPSQTEASVNLRQNDSSEFT
jgi:hypothetical protein